MFHKLVQNAGRAKGVSTLAPMPLNELRHAYTGAFASRVLSHSARTYYHKAEKIPHQWQHRMAVWDAFVQKHASDKPTDPISAAASAVLASEQKKPIEPASSPDLSIEVVLGDDVVQTTAHSFITTPFSLIPPSSPLSKSAIVCLVNGEPWDLSRPLEGSARVEILDFEHAKAQETLWHSSAHILGQALEYHYRDHHVSLSDGPALVDGGFFYDVFVQDAHDKPVTVSAEDLAGIQKTARYIVKDRQRFHRLVVPVATARELFKHNPFKLHTLDKIMDMARSGQAACTTPAADDVADAVCNTVAGADATEDTVLVTLYRCGPLIDLCRGPHLPRTDVAQAFQLDKTSSSLMKNPVPFNSVPTHAQTLAAKAAGAPADATVVGSPVPAIASVQRVYGIAYPSINLLQAHNERMKLAEQADHRRLGRVQELFMFHPLSPGSAFFLPHGTRVYNKLIDFLRAEYRKRGYNEVRTPQIFDKSLWERSGHWANYAEDMFYVSKGHVSAPTDGADPHTAAGFIIPADLTAAELQCVGVGEEAHHHCDHHGDVSNAHTQSSPDKATATQALKPMNCPGHCVLFGASLKSYRDLPFRVADFGGLHRNEVSGALSGLTRVRSFSQDDAHIFCTPEQMADELRGCLEFIQSVYAVFDFPLHFKLSTRPDNWIGSLENWDMAEKTLTDTLNASGVKWTENPGDGAFYGPKVDVTVRDALGRYHQCATIQLDFNLPQRFGLKYKGADGGEHTPVMIHRAILGSVERFMAVLLEHTIGKWPLWLSPRQVYISVVTDAQLPYALEVKKQMEEKGFYVDVADTSLRVAKQVKMAQPLQYNYIVTIGAAEAENGTLSIRPRGAFAAEPDAVTVDAFIQRLEQEVAKKM